MQRTLDGIAAAVLSGVLWLGARGLAPLPPLGPLVDPVRGAWALAREPVPAAERRARVPALGDAVEIRYDERGVPHIFAATELDALRALGYVVARDRLFQLELLWRAGAGRLTELVGARALPLDREARRLGLPHAMRRAWDALPDTTGLRRQFAAYAAGVNARLDELGPADLPLEYRLLGVAPARWEPIHSAYVLARMAQTLAWATPELQRAEAARLVGPEAARALFPDRAPLAAPILPRGAGARDPAPPSLPPPAIALADDTPPPPPHDADDERRMRGSNNWAVHARRTAAGRALLAGDPHLELTLPSIWYEAHLVTRDGLDVYLVTPPGTTAAAIGLSRALAWTVTSAEADVMDLWREAVDDEARPTRHQVDGTWRPLTPVVEAYRDARGRVVAADTIPWAAHGPLERRADGWWSRAWAAHGALDGVAAVGGLARAPDVATAAALWDGWVAPAFTVALADTAGRVGIRVAGRFPIRAGDGSGAELRDGSRSVEAWRGWEPPTRWPAVIDPAQGWVASANQDPFPPGEGFYVRADWGAPWRALRLDTLLRREAVLTAEAMARWQSDRVGERARRFAPWFVRAGQAATGAGAAVPALDSAVALLAAWDGSYALDAEAPVVFEAAMRALTLRTWDELRVVRGTGPAADTTAPAGFPSDAVLHALLEAPTSPWWDVRATEAVEDRDAVLVAALLDGWRTVGDRLGAPGMEARRWAKVRRARIGHVLQLPGLGRDADPQGGTETISPTGARGTHGSSWRMVVELDPAGPRAWGIVPGGQSGNPFGARYADQLPRWAAGQLDTLRLPRTAADLPGAPVLLLEPGR